MRSSASGKARAIMLEEVVGQAQRIVEAGV